MSDRYVVAPTRTEADLRAMAAIDTEAYGADNVAYSVLRSWWRRYPPGHTVISREGRVIGGVGLWPVSAEVYHLLRAGTLHKPDFIPLTAAEVAARDGQGHIGYWYLSGIALCVPYRRTSACAALLAQVAATWRARCAGSRVQRVGAMATSVVGARLLTHHGFTRPAGAAPVFFERFVEAGVPI